MVLSHPNQLPTNHLAIQRRENVFIIIATVFISSVLIMNFFGVSRFIEATLNIGHSQLPLLFPIGILAYPVTFLCTDLVSELYGAPRANFLVLCGLGANLWLAFYFWLAGILPQVPPQLMETHLPELTHSDYPFYAMRLFALSNIISSMLAYLVAQYLDVYLFHFWKKLTQGKHLWLRNNGSTLISQLVDTLIVFGFSYYWLKQHTELVSTHWTEQFKFILISSYSFKVLAALADTLPLYWAVQRLTHYFNCRS